MRSDADPDPDRGRGRDRDGARDRDESTRTGDWLRTTEGPTALVAWATAAWVGALVGWAAAPPSAPRTAVVGLGALVAVVLGVVVVGANRRPGEVCGGTSTGIAGPHRRLGRTLVGLVLVAGVAAGAAHVRATGLDRGPLARLAQRGGSAPMELTVASEATRRDDGTAWLLVTVTRVGGSHGRWRALVAGLRDPPAVGARLRAEATARPLDHDGFEGSLRRRHVGVELGVASWDEVAGATGMLGGIDRLRTAIGTAARSGLDGDPAALAVGLVTGDTRGLSPEAQDGMRATGLTHLVAVSGSNVALVLGVVVVLSRRWPRWLRRLALVVALVGFTLTTRVEPSVLRAAVMAALVLGCDLRGVPSGAVHALAGTILVLVLVDPASAGSLGLVLSALATGGVLVVAPALASRLPPRLPAPVRMLLAATLGAQVAVAPVLLATVGEVPLVSVPANLVAVPAAAVASVVATIGAALAPWVPGPAATVFAIAGPPLRLVLAVAAGMRGPVVSSADPVLAVLVTGVAVAFVSRRRGVARRVSLAVVVVAGLVAGPPGTRLQGMLDADVAVLAVTAIDVGQGDAILVTTGSGHRILVDAGGDDRAARWLGRRGIDRVDLLVLTHPHADHVGGLPDVLAGVAAGETWVAAEPDGSRPDLTHVPTSSGPRTVRLPARARVRGVWTGLEARLGSATIEVLGPPAGDVLVATEGGANDRSVVLRVTEGARVALLTGDAEVAAQQWLLDHAGTLEAGLLKVPHHGAATTDPAFLAAVDPQVAIVSAGRDNDYGHPAPRLLGWLHDLGVTVHRTDRDGTVTVPVPVPTDGRPSDREQANATSRSSPNTVLPPRPRGRRPTSRDLRRPGRHTGRSPGPRPHLAPRGRPGPGRCPSIAGGRTRSCRRPPARAPWWRRGSRPGPPRCCRRS